MCPAGFSFYLYVFYAVSQDDVNKLVAGIVAFVGNSVKLGQSKGRIIGLSYDYIHKYCGPPDSAAPVGNGIKHCIWQRGRCAVSLLFEEQDMCVGIDHISI